MKMNPNCRGSERSGYGVLAAHRAARGAFFSPQDQKSAQAAPPPPPPPYTHPLSSVRKSIRQGASPSLLACWRSTYARGPGPPGVCDWQMCMCMTSTGEQESVSLRRPPTMSSSLSLPSLSVVDWFRWQLLGREEDVEPGDDLWQPRMSVRHRCATDVPRMYLAK